MPMFRKDRVEVWVFRVVFDQKRQDSLFYGIFVRYRVGSFN